MTIMLPARAEFGFPNAPEHLMKSVEPLRLRQGMAG
jgi:hypothetical protein